MEKFKDLFKTFLSGLGQVLDQGFEQYLRLVFPDYDASIFAHESAEKLAFYPNKKTSIGTRDPVDCIEVSAKFSAEQQTKIVSYTWSVLSMTDFESLLGLMGDDSISEVTMRGHTSNYLKETTRTTTTPKLNILPGAMGRYFIIVRGLDSSSDPVATGIILVSMPAYCVLGWEDHLKSPMRIELAGVWKCPGKAYYLALLAQTHELIENVYRDINLCLLYDAKTRAYLKREKSELSHSNPFNYDPAQFNCGLIPGLSMNPLSMGILSTTDWQARIFEEARFSMPIYRKIFSDKAIDLKNYRDLSSLLFGTDNSTIGGYGPPPDWKKTNFNVKGTATIPSDSGIDLVLDAAAVLSAVTSDQFTIDDDMLKTLMPQISFYEGEVSGFAAVMSDYKNFDLQMNPWSNAPGLSQSLISKRPSDFLDYVSPDEMLQIRIAAKKTTVGRDLQVTCLARLTAFLVSHEVGHAIGINHTFEKNGESTSFRLNSAIAGDDKYRIMRKYPFALMGATYHRPAELLTGIKVSDRAKAKFTDTFGGDHTKVNIAFAPPVLEDAKRMLPI